MAKFLGVSAARGRSTRTRVPIGEFADGSPIAVPVAVFAGKADGPTLYVQAGLHGDELTGVEVCRRLLSTLEPERMSGTVVAVPVANIPSYLTRTRGYLHEERWLVDVNRSFPGTEHGLLSHRLAHILLHEFVVHADLTIDLHSALDGCDIAPFTYLDPADDETGTLELREQVSAQFGLPYVYRKARGANLGTSQMTNTLATQGDERGAAVMIAEMGESRRVTERAVDLGVRGIRNAMVTLGLLNEQPAEVEPPRPFTTLHVVHVERGGGLRLRVRLGDEVRAGEEMGTVVDVFGDVVERLTAPADGFVLRRMELASVSTGAEAVWVAK
jgi:predicted deacylase